MTEDWFEVRDSETGEVTYRVPYPRTEPQIRKELDAQRRMAASMADGIAQVFGKPRRPTFAQNFLQAARTSGRYAEPLPRDDPTISTEAIECQLRTWQLEAQLGIEPSACLYFNDLESEPPTVTQLEGLLRHRRDQAALVARSETKKIQRRAITVAFSAIMMVWFFVLLVLTAVI
jgi:hypothetical protein